MTLQLDIQARVTVDNSGAVGPLKETQRATDEMARSARNAGTSMGQSGSRIAAASRQAEVAQISAARAARESGSVYRQLGFQISDVAARSAAGANPLLAFGQGAGKAAGALGGLGGAVGKAAVGLAGPFGVAILAAGATLGFLINKVIDAGDSAADLADKFGDAAADVEILSGDMSGAIGELRGILAAAKGWFNDFAFGVAGSLATAVNEVADFVERSNGLIPRVLGGGPALLDSRLALQRAAAEQQLEGRRRDRALATSDVTRSIESAFGFDPYKGFQENAAEYGRTVRRSADETDREARRAADAAVRESKRAADAAAREAARYAAEQAKLIEGLAQIARKAGQEIDRIARGDGTLVGLIGRLDAAAASRDAIDRQSRNATGLAAAVSSAEANIDYRRVQEEIAAGQQQIARAQAEAFNQAVLAEAGFLGSAIGGAAGRLIENAAGIAQGLGTGDFRGVPGRAGGVLSLTSLAVGQDGWKQVTGKLDEVFGGQSGDGSFLKRFSGIVASAGIGASVAGSSIENQIGGAVGGVLGKEIGEKVGKALGKELGGLAGPLGGALGAIAGGILGSVVGGLFTTTKRGSVSITGSGGQINQGAAIGNGGQQVQAAGILGNNFTNSLNSIVERLNGTVGTFAVSIGQSGKNFRVDTTGQGRTNKKNAGVLAFGEDADAAIQAALADAIRDGAVAGVSPRVQSVLRQYADNLDRAVAEALKVQNLENFLADRQNPFGRAFRDFERQAAERLKVARQYGFDVLEIEKANAEERAKLLKDQLAQTTASARALLDDLRFGSRAEGSVSERLAALGTERARLEGLVSGGDASQIDALAQIIQQQLDLSREAFGSTGQFAADRSGAISSLETLIRQTEDRINAAATAAETATVDKLTELNSTADEQMTELQRQTAILESLRAFGGLGAFNIGAFARIAV